MVFLICLKCISDTSREISFFSVQIRSNGANQLIFALIEGTKLGELQQESILFMSQAH